MAAAMTLRPYQQEARESIEAEWEKGNKKTLLVLPTGCHEARQGILMYSGRIRQACEIRKGQLLMGPDGNPRRVLALHHGKDKMFRITPVKGNPFVVNSEHLLPLVRTQEAKDPIYPCEMHGGEIDLIKACEWERQTKWWRHIHKIYRSNLIERFNGNDGQDLTIPPYFLGILIGDGGLKHGINITTPDPEIASEILSQAEVNSWEIRTESAGKAMTHFIKSGELGCKGGRLRNQLSELGLFGKGSAEKHIPFQYKTAPANARKDLLAGLIDTDGSLSNGTYDFVSKSKQLAEDVAFVARSLGLAAYTARTEKSIKEIEFSGIYYRVCISGEIDIVPCRVERKKAESRKQKKDVLRTGIRSVEEIGCGEYFGFTVDGDNLYLMDDFTVTHNCGKTIVFSKVAEDMARKGKKVLILAHRGELLEQAADKLKKSTGLECAIEKAELSSEKSWNAVTVGSVQSMQRPTRLERFREDHFGTIIVDEAHHAISAGYQAVLSHFPNADVLGVTATPDRGDMRNLGEYFESLAYEYTLPKAIRDGYLCPIKALAVPLKLDISSVKMQNGDFAAGDLGHALEPYLELIAMEMRKYCAGRKTVAFLPLVSTSQKFREVLEGAGFRAAEVNGNSKDRAEILADFDAGKYDVLCNSMLLTEGWDCPSVDCIVCLRPTKSRALYSQIVGRGTRLCPETGKKNLLLIDFLWLTEKHALCHPASLICESEEIAEQMTRNMEENAGEEVDIEEAEKEAAEDVVRQREEALAKELAAQRYRKKRLVDPLQYEMSINAADLATYVPSFGWQMEPPTQKQKDLLEKRGICPDEIDSAGKAEMLIDRLIARQQAGLATPRQIRCLEKYGFRQVGTWGFEQARGMIDRIAANGWRVPRGVDAYAYRPQGASEGGESIGWEFAI